jgi:hypothetical protein
MDLGFKKHQSQYEQYHVKWNGLNYDKDILIKFIRRLRWLKLVSTFSKNLKDELRIMKTILDSYDEDVINGLLNNDENISRICFIEKWARRGAIELVTSGTFTKETYGTISQIPLKDYQLLTKRIQELMNLAESVTSQNDKSSNETPGL